MFLRIINYPTGVLLKTFHLHASDKRKYRQRQQTQMQNHKGRGRYDESRDEYLNRLNEEFGMRIRHNQHVINSMKSTVDAFVASSREKDLDGVDELLCRLVKIEKKFPRSQYDDEIFDHAQSKLLKLELLEQLRARNLITAIMGPQIMTAADNSAYRELCSSDKEDDEYHDDHIPK